MSTKHSNLRAGIQSYVPVCYKSYIRIQYVHTGPLMNGILDDVLKCGKDIKWVLGGKFSIPCNYIAYLNLSKHKFPPGTNIEPFSFDNNRTLQVNHLKRAAETLRKPEENPSIGKECTLQCVNISAQSKVVLYSIKYPGVIGSFRIQITENNKVPFDWNSLTLSMHFDGTRDLQVQDIPMGVLFGASQPDGQRLNDFNGASIGRKRLKCTTSSKYDNESSFKSKNDWVGYIYFPMPFWSSAKISLKNLHSSQQYRVCAQAVVLTNLYTLQTTGYFSMQSRQYIDDGKGWKDILSVQNSWGHVVGLIGEFSNLLPSLLVAGRHPHRGAVEADILMYIDGSKAASVIGSGIEDYFGYGHEFVGVENTTYSFVGCPYGNPYSAAPTYPLSRHFYRLQILDPIPFHDSITIGVEGYHRDVDIRTAKKTSIGVEKFHTLKSKFNYTNAYIALYYAKTGKGLILSDQIMVSEQRARVILYQSSLVKTKSPVFKQFQVDQSLFLGDVREMKTYTKHGLEFNIGDSFNVTMKINHKNKGILLRREFHTIPIKQWEEKARVWVDGVDHSIWMFGIGTTSIKHALRQGDFLLNPTVTLGKASITITIKPLTLWRDISYQVFSIL